MTKCVPINLRILDDGQHQPRSLTLCRKSSFKGEREKEGKKEVVVAEERGTSIICQQVFTSKQKLLK